MLSEREVSKPKSTSHEPTSAEVNVEVEPESSSSPKNKNRENAENDDSGQDEDSDSGFAKTVGLLIIGLVICAGIGIAVYYGVAAILKNVQGDIEKEMNSTETSNEGKSNSTQILENSISNDDSVQNGATSDSTSDDISTTKTTTTTDLTSTTPPPKTLSRNLYTCDDDNIALRGGNKNWNWIAKVLITKIGGEGNDTDIVEEEEEDFRLPGETQKYNIPFCTASIISNYTLITSAECCEVLKSPGIESVAWIGAERYERKIVNFKIHEEYEDGQDEDHANVNDVCLLQIDRDILFSEGERLNTDAICLPKQDRHVSAGESCFAAGFGSFQNGTEEDSPLSYYDSLREIELETISDRNCRRTEQSSSGFKYGKMFCAEYRRLIPEEACSIDYGSSLICVQQNRPYLFGTLSLGYKCGLEDYPSIFVKTTSYIDWIQQNTFYTNRS